MKYIVLHHQGLEFGFRFPAIKGITSAEFADTVRHIRVDGPRGSWDRKFRDAQIVSAGFISVTGECFGKSESLGLDSRPEDGELFKDCKYVVLCGEEGEHFFTCPNHLSFSHINFAEILRHNLICCEAVSAGFVSSTGYCYGRSDSLGIDSRPEDADLFQSLH